MDRDRDRRGEEQEGEQPGAAPQVRPTPSEQRYGGSALRVAMARTGAGTAGPATAGDVAAAAIAGKDGGDQVPSDVRGKVEPQLGVDLSPVRVHQDPLARQASAAMGARAFAYQGDVFLGPGESAGDAGLMAHELTHVAQQGAAGPALQQQVAVGAADSPAERQADAVAGRVVGNEPPANLIVDGAALGPGQIARTEFLSRLREAVTAAVDAALGPVWSAVGCPYIEAWFARHQGTDARTLEQLARRYSGVQAPRSAADYIPPICARIAAGARTWSAGGDVSADLQAAGLSAPAAAGPAPAGGDDSAAGTAQLKPVAPDGDAARRPLAAELGAGEPLDAGVRDRVGSAFGEDLGDVRVHTGPEAARKTSAADAAALTVGRDIAFAPGEYQPGTPHGDALLAHELAHTVQQKGAADARPGERPAVARESGAHEEDADKAATGVMARLYGGARDMLGRVGPALTSGFQLQRCPPKPKAPPISTAHGADQRGAAEVPDATRQQELAALLDPNAFVPAPAPAPAPGGGPAPAPAPPVAVIWDGKTGQANAAANRAALRTKLLNGLTAFLASKQAGITALKAQPRVAMTGAGTGALAGKDTGVQGIAVAAAGVLEGRYGVSMDAAVRTPGQQAIRSAPMNATTGAADQTLFDAYSKADRQRMLGGLSDADLAFGVGWWAIKHDANLTPHTSHHHFSPAWHSGEEDWVFLDSAVRAFMAQGSNQADLIDYRLYMWNETADKGIALLTTFDPATHGGDAKKAERAARWQIFGSTLHETLHFRTHPAFEAAEQGRATMSEGFVEMFTQDAATPALAAARGGSNEPLRMAVEGVTDPLDASLIPAAKAVSPSYQTDYQNALAVRAKTSDEACRAAFFQGHVELLGLAPDGSQLAGARAAGAAVTIGKPPGIASLSALATATGLTEAEIKAANPGITDALMAQMVLPGCREHIVVGTSDSTGASAVESRAQIAAQHGVSEADLVRANPGIRVDASTNAWPALTVGQKILIPKH